MAAKKRPASPSPRKDGDEKSTSARSGAGRRPWDPSAVPPAESSPMGADEREFHATHFTADPRGKVKPGSAPDGKRAQRRRGGAR